MSSKDESERKDRIAVRNFLSNIIKNLASYGGGEGSIPYPGQSVEVSEKDWDDSYDSVSFYLVTRTEFKEWLMSMAPERGGIHVRKKNGAADTWYAECDDCGLVYEGEMTAKGHDDTVRAWFSHDKEKHEGSGKIPYHMLIEDRVRKTGS